MIVDKFELRSETTGIIASFNVAGVSSTDPYILKASTGLDATDILAIDYGFGTTGNRFLEMMMETREIVLRIRLNPKYFPNGKRQDLRESLYKAISSARDPKLFFDLCYEDEIVATISGVMTKLESSHFTATPEVQLTLRCEQPIFKAPERTVIDDISSLSEVFTIDVDEGSAPTGFKGSFIINNPVSLFGLQGEDWNFTINKAFYAGDVIYFSSEYENNELYVYSPSLVTIDFDGIIHLSDKLSLHSMWPVLFPGENVFTVQSNPANFSYVEFSYFASYWGV